MMNLIEIGQELGKLKDWSIEGNTIVKERFLGGQKGAYEFVKRVAEVCEKFDHYPDMIVLGNTVRIVLTTKGEGVTLMDFNVAGAIDAID